MFNRAVFLHSLRRFADGGARPAALGLLLLLVFALQGLLVGGGQMQFNLNGAQLPLEWTPALRLRLLAGLGNPFFSGLSILLSLGLVRRDFREGGAQLVLLRPLSRASYLLSRWAAAAAVNAALVLLVHGLLLLRAGWSFLPAQDWALLLLAQLLQSAAATALVALLSCTRAGELAWLALGALGLGLAWVLLRQFSAAAAAELAGWGWHLLFPHIGLPERWLLGEEGPRLLESLPLHLGLAAACLAGGAALLQRRELSYAESA